jgi:ribosomal protein S6
MSKLKKEGSSHYEMLYIVPNKYTEDEAKEIHKNTKKIITDEEGSITHEEE